ncbi:MAG: antitoxin [Spirochaetaceae bacterium]|nr:MAG: antitoxin [Spirochaetaceae bacterium]
MTEHDEQDLIASVENGEWQSVHNVESLKQQLKQAADRTGQKDYRINVRISKRDVDALKALALEEGLPYQTLITSILHKYVSGRMVDRRETSG